MQARPSLSQPKPKPSAPSQASHASQPKPLSQPAYSSLLGGAIG